MRLYLTSICTTMIHTAMIRTTMIRTAMIRTTMRLLLFLLVGSIALIATYAPLQAAQSTREVQQANRPVLQTSITMEKAIELALASNPGGQVIEAELDHDDGWLIYKIRLSNGAKVQIDAINGALLGVELDDASLWAQSVKTTLAQASSATLAAYPDATVVEAELKNDDGWLVFRLKLNNGLKVYVDATTGAVLGQEGYYSGTATNSANNRNREAATITLQAAQQAAETAYPYAGSASQVQLKYKNGRMVYQVEFIDDGQVIIDAATGAVLGQEAGKASFANRQPATSAAPVGLQAARDAALAAHTGQIKKVELDYELGTLVYIVKFFDGFKVMVDAASGTVLGQEGNHGQPSYGLGANPAITIQAARQAAEEHVGMGMAKKVELENNYGRLIYKVEFANDTTVLVDGTSGAVLAVEYDD